MTETAPPKKLMHLNFFETSCTGSHMSVGQWKSPEDNSRYKDRLEYYLWLAKLADKGKITSIFFADTYACHETYQGSADATFKGGSQVATLDPVILVSAMAAVTKSVSFGITGSTSYIAPYILGRTWSSLDHITRGRIGWNVVTSYSNHAAKAMGKEQVMAADERYKAAHEYMDLMYMLWEQSWEDGAQMWSASDPEMAYDPSKIHRIKFDGNYHKLNGFHQTHPSPQRTPVLFQAGASKSGIAFAGKHAEGIYTDLGSIPDMKRYTKAVRDAARENGRDPSTIKFFAAIVPILGRTVEEAQAKYEKAKKNICIEAGLAKFSSYTGIDLAQYPMDEPFVFEGKTGQANTITGVIQNMKTLLDNTEGEMTPRKLGELLGLGGSTPMPIGTPEMVADVFEKWFNETDIDGFNLVYVSNPESYEDIVELLVPELQKRGLMWQDYAVPGGTFRENLHVRPGEPFLPADHPGSKFKWNAQEVKETVQHEEAAVEAAEPTPAAASLEGSEQSSMQSMQAPTAVTA